MILNFEKFLFEQYLLTEANDIVDLRPDKEELFSAVLVKNALVVFSSGRQMVKSKYAKTRPDIQVIVDGDKKTISLPSDTGQYLDFSGGERGPVPKTFQVLQTQAPQLLNKIVDELRKHGFIDSSYTLLDNHSKYAVSDKPRSTINANPNSIILYHGTTSIAADQILKKGLRPQDTNTLADLSLFRGNASTIKGYTEKNVYLSPAIDIAKQYAIRQAFGNDKHPKNGNPVVLKVIIPDPGLIMVDDDELIGGLQKVIFEENDKVSKRLAKAPQAIKNQVYKQYEELANSNAYIDAVVNSMDSKAEFYMKFVLTPWSTNYIPIYGSMTNMLIQENLFEMVFKNSIGNKNPLFGEKGGIDGVVSNSSSNKIIAAQNKFYQDEIPGFYPWLLKTVRESYPKIINQNWQKSAYSDSQAIGYHGIIMPKFITIETNVDFSTRSAFGGFGF